MTPRRRTRSTTARAGESATLHRALDRSEQVTVKVEEAAEELSDVNAALQEEVAAGVPVAQVRGALDKSEAVETKVQEAAVDLVAVNEALTEEVAERDALEHRVSQTATEFADALVARVAEETDIDGIKLSVRASVGIAIFPEDAQSAEELLQCADMAMYAAKLGRLGVSRYAPAETAGRRAALDAGR